MANRQSTTVFSSCVMVWEDNRKAKWHQPHRAKADIAHLTDIKSGDYFFLCSDGILEQTSDENLVNVITKKGVSNEEKIEQLRCLTEENKDNHTAHLIYIKGVEGTE